MLPLPDTTSISPTTTTTTSFVDEDDLWDEDDEKKPPPHKKNKSLWGDDVVVSKSTECSMMWYFARPEVLRLFVVIKCFPGITISIKQTSRTTIFFSFTLDFTSDEMYVISQYYDIDYVLAAHNLPPREITTFIDVKHTILEVKQVSEKKSPAKVFRVKV